MIKITQGYLSTSKVNTKSIAGCAGTRHSRPVARKTSSSPEQYFQPATIRIYSYSRIVFQRQRERERERERREREREREGEGGREGEGREGERGGGREGREGEREREREARIAE